MASVPNLTMSKVRSSPLTFLLLIGAPVALLLTSPGVTQIRIPLMTFVRNVVKPKAVLFLKRTSLTLCLLRIPTSVPRLAWLLPAGIAKSLTLVVLSSVVPPWLVYLAAVTRAPVILRLRSIPVLKGTCKASLMTTCSGPPFFGTWEASRGLLTTMARILITTLARVSCSRRMCLSVVGLATYRDLLAWAVTPLLRDTVVPTMMKGLPPMTHPTNTLPKWSSLLVRMLATILTLVVRSPPMLCLEINGPGLKVVTMI